MEVAREVVKKKSSFIHDVYKIPICFDNNAAAVAAAVIHSTGMLSMKRNFYYPSKKLYLCKMDRKLYTHICT